MEPAYKSFAQIYDLFMRDVPYDNWICYLEKLWSQYNLTPKLIAELGCGTGNITIRLAKKQYDMIGIDISSDMLTIAKQKSFEQNLNILYLLQDITAFELYGTVDCIISLCDSLNYILKENHLFQTFKLVNNYLNPNGLFIFDLNTEYKFKKVLAKNTFAETTKTAAYIWENYYDNQKKLNEYYMNFFIKTKDSYKRFEELHYEKSYSIDTIKKLLAKAGLKLLNVYDAFTFNEPKKNSERVYFIAQKQS